MRQSAVVPQPVNPQLNLPARPPRLPQSIHARFGAEIGDFDAEMERFWLRTRRALEDGHREIGFPLNEVKQDSRNIRKEFVAADATLSASFTEQIDVVTTSVSALATRTTTLESQVQHPTGGLLARVNTIETTYATQTFAEAKKTEAITAAAANTTAAVTAESTARATADGNLSAKHTLKASVRGSDGKTIVTGLNITSASGPGTDLSEINLQADRLNLTTATGPVIRLLDITTNGFVFGTDATSDGFVAGVSGWRLKRDGTFEFNGGTIRSDVEVGQAANKISISSVISGGSFDYAILRAWAQKVDLTAAIMGDLRAVSQAAGSPAYAELRLLTEAAASLILSTAGGTPEVRVFDGTNYSRVYANRIETPRVQVGGAIDIVGSTGNIAATSFSGSGASITGINAGNISSGTLSNSRLGFSVGSMASQNSGSVGITGGTVDGCTSNGFVYSGVTGTSRISFGWDSVNNRIGIWVDGVLKCLVAGL